RLLKLTDNERPPEQLFFTYSWRALDVGGIDDLATWVDAHPQARLIVIDTFHHVRPNSRPGASIYGEDYSALAPLQKFAGERQIAIVVVNHTRKAGSEDDALDEISGSTGLTGAVDNLLLMRRENGVTQLMRRGRDYEDTTEIALKGDPTTLLW